MLQFDNIRAYIVGWVQGLAIANADPHRAYRLEYRGLELLTLMEIFSMQPNVLTRSCLTYGIRVEICPLTERNISMLMTWQNLFSKKYYLSNHLGFVSYNSLYI